MPSSPCRPMTMPRRRARSSSVKSPSGLRQSIKTAAYLASSSGRYSSAFLAKSASAACRVSRSTPSGSRRKKLRITVTWPSPTRPLRCASAVAVSWGDNVSPVNARRPPRSAASAMRRLASAREMRSRFASAPASRPPNSSSPACSASWLINACVGTRSRLAVASKRSNTRKRSGVVSTSNDKPHNRSTSVSSTSRPSTMSSRALDVMRPMLCRGSDTNRRSVTTEIKVAQVI